MKWRLSIVILSAASLGATACGESGGGGSGLSSGDGYSVSGALAELPAATAADDGGLLIQTGDLAAATELLELERPEDAHADTIVDWIGPLTGFPQGGDDFPPVFVPLAGMLQPRDGTQLGEFDEALGWSLIDADAFVEYTTPPATFTVITGDFDEGTLNPDLTEVSDRVVSFGEGDDMVLTETNAVDRLGRPLRLAQDGNRISASHSTPLVEQWAAGPDETLADDARLASVAAALDEADVVAAALAEIDGGIGQPGDREFPAEMAEEVTDRFERHAPAGPFDVVGIGWAVDDGAAVITVAYHFGTGDDASAAINSLEAVYTESVSLSTNQPISDLVTLNDITADDEVVSVTLTLPPQTRPQVVYDMLMRQDLPFTSR